MCSLNLVAQRIQITGNVLYRSIKGRIYLDFYILPVLYRGPRAFAPAACPRRSPGAVRIQTPFSAPQPPWVLFAGHGGSRTQCRSGELRGNNHHTRLVDPFDTELDKAFNLCLRS
eukprot:1982592-Pleurochrysis_carterae.AAC.1